MTRITDILVVSGTSNPGLASDIAGGLACKFSRAFVSKFSDGEFDVRISMDDLSNVGSVVLVQSLCAPVNDNIIEMMLIVDAIRRVSSAEIILIIPYLGYARQDRVISTGGLSSSLSSKVVADVLSIADRVITLDVHSQQIQGFFDVPITNIDTTNFFCKRCDSIEVVVSPDLGGVSRARNVLLNYPGARFSIIDKYRSSPGISQVMNVLGDSVKGKRCVLFDDIVDSAGTLCNSSDYLISQGAVSIDAYITHGIFSGNAFDKISNSNIRMIFTTDTIPHDNLIPKISVLPVSSIIVENLRKMV